MKKIISIILVILLSIAIIVFIFFNFSTEIENNVEIKNEIQPEEEIAEDQNYNTEIKLYYCDRESGILTAESKIIDSRNLLDNPYEYVLNILICGPENQNLINVIPKNTKINNTKLEKNTLLIDLTEDFLNSSGMDAIYSIVNTVTEFNEVNNVKFLIDGKQNEQIKNVFTRQN